MVNNFRSITVWPAFRAGETNQQEKGAPGIDG
jgi:hypothetical protein